MLNRFLPLILSIGLMFATLATWSSVAAQTNLISNGGFETGGLTGWNTTGGSDFSVTTGDTAGGTYKLEYSWTSATDPFEFINQTFATTDGITYTIVLSYQNAINTDGGFLLVLDGGAGSGVGDFSTTGVNECLSGYCHLQVQFTAQHETTRLKLNRIGNAGDFTIYIDNIEAYEGDPPAAATPTPTQTLTPTFTPTPAGCISPNNILASQNGCFETGDFTGWNAPGGNSIVLNSIQYQGSHSAVLNSSGDGVVVSKTQSVSDSTSYTIGFYYQWIQNTEGSIGFSAYPTAGGAAYFDNNIAYQGSCDGDWCNYETTFSSTSDSVTFEISDGGGFFEVSIDGFYLIEGVSTATPTPTPTNTPAAGVCVSVDNVLTNGCFETGNFTGWFQNYSVITTTESYNGSYSAVLSDVDLGTEVQMLSTDYFSVLAGTTYEFSFWYKNIEPTPSGDVYISFNDDEFILYNNVFFDSSGCVDWCQFTTSIFTVRTNLIVVFKHNNSDGFEFYIDDISLVRETNPTATPQPTATPFTLEFPTPQYYIDLPSGGRADIYMEASVGEVGVMVGLFSLSSLGTFIVLRDTARIANSNERD